MQQSLENQSSETVGLSTRLLSSAVLRRQLWVYGLLLGLLLIVLAALYFQQYGKERELRTQQLVHWQDLANEIINRDLRRVRSDILFLADLDVTRKVRADNPDSRRLLAETFLNLSEKKRTRLQIRLINRDGRELVRVDRVNNQSQVLSDSELQDKSSRYYVQEGLKLKPGEIYISDFDLNQEQGEIEVPLKPVIRFVTPVPTSEGEAGNLLVFNYNGSQLIQELRQTTWLGKIYLVRSDGYFLLGPDRDAEWGRILGHERKFADYFPSASWLISGENISNADDSNREISEAEEDPETVWTSDGGFFVQPHVIRFSPGNFGAIPSEGTTDIQLVSHMTNEAAFTETRSLLKQLLLLGVIMAIPLALITRIWAVAAMNRDESERQLRQEKEMLSQAQVEMKNLLASNQSMVDLLSYTDGVWDYDVETGEIKFAPGWWSMLGYDAGQNDGQPETLETFQSRLHPDDQDVLQTIISENAARELRDDPNPHIRDFRLKTKMGAYIWVRCRTMSGYDESGNVIRIVGSLQDITVEKNALQALLREKEALIKSNEELEQFAFVASHDLQEPLRKIIAYTDMIEEDFGDQLPEEGLRQLTVVTDGARRLRDLVADLLSFSRITTRGKQLVPTSATAALQAALSNLEVAIEECGARITSDDLPSVTADSSQLTMLFQNLISNSLKYRAEKTLEIHIGVRKITSGYEIFVRDNGIGIEPEYHEKIFEIFKRLHSRTERGGGTGIGLANCRRIVERFGGRIWVDSEAGQGSTFYFTVNENHSGDS